MASKTRFYFGFLFLLCSYGHAQSYTPIDTTNTELKESFLLSYKDKIDLFKKEIKSNYKSKLNKYITKNYKEYSERFSEEIKAGRFIFEEEISQFVLNVFNTIKKENPELEKYNIKILVAKNHTLNAYCLMDGTFVVNIGLFYWLDNEDQFASVLCHEIAHKVLEHGLKNLEYNFIENKNSNEKLNALKKVKYNKSDKAFSIFQERLYANGNRAKKHEFEADSLGYLLYNKTKYSKSEYLSALKFMQYYDSIKPAGLEQKVYKKYFDLPEQPFNEKWLLKEDFSSYDYSNFSEKINKDSISSHPETIERIDAISTLFPEVNTVVAPLNPNSKKYSELNNIAYLEAIPNLYFTEQYGYSLYVCLLYLEKDKQNKEYFKKWLGYSFQKIYEARKNYTLNRYLDRLVPNEQSESYQQFISFMWNLSLNEIKHIADYYSA